MLLMMANGQAVDTDLLCHLNGRLGQEGTRMRSFAELGKMPGLMGYGTPYDELLSDALSRYQKWKQMHGERMPNPFLPHQ